MVCALRTPWRQGAPENTRNSGEWEPTADGRSNRQPTHNNPNNHKIMHNTLYA